jgi:hypothetical protein
MVFYFASTEDVRSVVANLLILNNSYNFLLHFQINDEPVEDVTTSDIIDGLRIIRGSICLTVLRRN